MIAKRLFGNDSESLLEELRENMLGTSVLEKAKTWREEIFEGEKSFSNILMHANRPYQPNESKRLFGQMIAKSLFAKRDGEGKERSDWPPQQQEREEEVGRNTKRKREARTDTEGIPNNDISYIQSERLLRHQGERVWKRAKKQTVKYEGN